MFAPTRYIDWVRAHHGRAPFDLATSGMPKIALRDFISLAEIDLDDPNGWRALTNAIARFHEVDAGEVIPALGTTNALWLAYTCAIEPGDDVLVESPAYEPLVRTAEGIGARVVRFPRADSPCFQLDPARIANAITPRTRVVAISNLHNPSGTRASDDAIREIARIAAAHGAHLLVDEVYAPFDTFLDAPGTFSRSARKLAPNVIAIGSLTKCFGLGDQRIGWMLAPREIIRRAEDAFTSAAGHLPASWTNLGAHAFTHIDWLAARARDLVRGKRERVAEWMRTRKELTWSAPASGLFGFAVHASQRDLTPVIEAGIDAHGVLVAAGSFFGVANGFRLAWSIDRDRLDEGLTRLGRVLDTL